MSLSAEQKQTVASWIAAGESLSNVQKKLSEQFKLSLTYMEVRFLVDDLGLEVKDTPKKTTAASHDLSKPAPAPAAPAAQPDEDDALPPGGDAGFEEVADEAPPQRAGGVTVDVDPIVRPGALVSGSVTFSDGQTAKWGLDQYGRLMFDPAQKGYRPGPQDLQDFQLELQSVLERKGMY